MRNLIRTIFPSGLSDPRWQGVSGLVGIVGILLAVLVPYVAGVGGGEPILSIGYSQPVAELKITLLRPGPPGQLISQSGDIDNRLKTLLDALKVPKEPTALPQGESPLENETPFFCLLEDDSLITAVAVETDRLLEAPADPNDVLLLIHVTTRITRAIWGNSGLGS